MIPFYGPADRAVNVGSCGGNAHGLHSDTGSGPSDTHSVTRSKQFLFGPIDGRWAGITHHCREATHERES